MVKIPRQTFFLNDQVALDTNQLTFLLDLQVLSLYLPSSSSLLKPLLHETLLLRSQFLIAAFNMAPAAISPLEKEDHGRDAAFNKILHGTSAEKRGGMMAMLSKDAASQKAALEDYFKHWDNKTADTETEEIRKARREEYATLTRQYALHLGLSNTDMLIDLAATTT